MVDVLKKALYASVGVAFMTKDKIIELGTKMATDFNASESDGKKLVDDLLKKSDEAKKAIEKTVHDGIETAMKKLDITTKSEVAELKKRLEALEKSTGIRA